MNQIKRSYRLITGSKITLVGTEKEVNSVIINIISRNRGLIQFLGA